MNPIIDGAQSALKLWGEEEEEQAFYHVYLKKIRYHHSKEELSNDISYLEWETIKVRQIKAGTLDKLVDSLVNDSGELDSSYMNIFLATYRSFATPIAVVTSLTNRYKLLDKDNFRLRKDLKECFEKVFLAWLDMYPEDFYEPPDYPSLLKINEIIHVFECDSSRNSCTLELKAEYMLYTYKQYGRPSSRHPTEIPNDANLSLSNNYNVDHKKLFEITDKDFAMQLTYADSELFKKLVPYQCLGSIWSRRDKVSGWKVIPTTVTATVDQFNAVSLRVITTILHETTKPNMRAKVIVKWINVAMELRLLKNFSSLKAITAALQSNPIHRLEKTWLVVPKGKLQMFSELSSIFSEDNNQTNCRELLIKEGSAKFVSSDFCCKSAKNCSNTYIYTMQGTIPYLGIFLTDLTMIDAAIPDHLPNGLINFDKKRKEFEILAQIKLLQSAANNYDIKFDSKFHIFFKSIPVRDDEYSYNLSRLIEPPACFRNGKRGVFGKSVFKWSHQKSGSSSSSSNDLWGERINTNFNTNFKSSKSLSSLSISQNDSNSVCDTSIQDFSIIKVSTDQRTCDIEGVNVYKSIMLNNNDRTRTVIANALTKHGIENTPDDYILIQLFPDGEIIIPESANVYYAINRSHELKFLLRRRLKVGTSSKHK